MEPSLAGAIPQFGTELVTASDDFIVFPGASAGASTAVWIMLGVIERCFRDKLTSAGWADRSKEMIPSYGSSLIDNPDLPRVCAQKRRC